MSAQTETDYPDHLHDQNVEALIEGVVEQEHHCREIPGELRVPKQHLSNVTDVPYLGMAEAEFPGFRKYQPKAHSRRTYQTTSEV